MCKWNCLYLTCTTAIPLISASSANELCRTNHASLTFWWSAWWRWIVFCYLFTLPSTRGTSFPIIDYRCFFLYVFLEDSIWQLEYELIYKSIYKWIEKWLFTTWIKSLEWDCAEELTTGVIVISVRAWKNLVLSKDEFLFLA